MFANGIGCKFLVNDGISSHELIFCRMDINLHQRRFVALSNTENGEVSGDTLFQYFQEGAVVWAEYAGGMVRKGFLVGKVVGEGIEFTYQHLNTEDELVTGKCHSKPILMEDGRVRLQEQWQWTCRDYSKGESVLVEVSDETIALMDMIEMSERDIVEGNLISQEEMNQRNLEWLDGL